MSSKAVEIAQALIRCPSVTPLEAGALDYLQSVLDGLGFTCQRLPFTQEGTDPVDNLYARYGTSGKNLCFAGHTDVVPVGQVDRWKFDPFGAVIEDGVLYGRGVSDMKGGIACWVAALVDLFESGWRPSGSLSLLITGDEEGPSINGTVKMLSHLSDKGETWDACITGEPTCDQTIGDVIKIGRRGCLDGHIVAYGKQGHTGYPHMADNAAHRLLAMLQGLVAWQIDAGTDYFDPSNLAVSTMDIGNPAVNIIPGQAKASFNLRYTNLHTGESLEKNIREVLTKGAGGAEHYTLEIHNQGNAFLTEPGTLTQVVAKACEEVCALTPKFSTSGGTSDSRFISNYCQVVDFGLRNHTIHQVNESAPVADINRLTQVYKRIIETYFAG
ncbi:succinyl-diaminopimelate desuccinylase [Terasakiella pusilla]|uniref:succinyl-diaminopimelate desuccinylase n=1 Tax=Terasakiella pusilla TaxID=64973 RepID=UPI0004908BEF|nr:succinyl-diaminopimelate desuccinylase [Terasakiella pusilla]